MPALVAAITPETELYTQAAVGSQSADKTDLIQKMNICIQDLVWFKAEALTPDAKCAGILASAGAYGGNYTRDRAPYSRATCTVGSQSADLTTFVQKIKNSSEDLV